ncbi:MAG: methylated-DNA--[protein]-cysteine S-methyltransferase [Acidobacteriota bacterium]
MAKREPEHTTYYTYLDTPVGTLLLAGCRDHGLKYLSFQRGKGAKVPESQWQRSDAPFRDAVRQLKEYFRGKRVAFDLKLNPKGTPFQLEVWRALTTIPYGATRSYAQIAKRVGRPLAVRAVGLANGRNPLPIIVPCHRVIGSGGQLVGYGGGLPVKQALLQLEGVALTADGLIPPRRRPSKR